MTLTHAGVNFTEDSALFPPTSLPYGLLYGTYLKEGSGNGSMYDCQLEACEEYDDALFGCNRTALQVAAG